MQRTLYLRPTALFPALPDTAKGEVWGGLPLAGTAFAFAAVEAIERMGTGTRRRTIGLGEVFERDWGRQTLAAADMVEHMRSPRPRLAGLALDRPRLMGIVNVTPDSFSDGGRYGTTEAAIAHALQLADEGAEILDIGGESTRPGSDPVPVDEELGRVLPVIEGLAGKSEARLSIDTRKAEVMRRAAAAGADMFNDVSALTHDSEALEAVAETGLPVVLMHAQGDPKTMQHAPRYNDVLLDVFDYLEERIAACEAAGIDRKRIVVDPGIGFGKTLEHNLALLAGLSLFHGLGVPLLVGASRKRFIGTLTGVAAADQRVAGSIGVALAAAGQGAHIVRVHDVKQTREALAVWEAATLGKAPGGAT
jgi:dihydropteroate synthase